MKQAFSVTSLEEEKLSNAQVQNVFFKLARSKHIIKLNNFLINKKNKVITNTF